MEDINEGLSGTWQMTWLACMLREVVSGSHLYRILDDSPRVAAKI